MRISKTFRFDAAHRLPSHAGKCAALHGHTYAVTLEFEGGTNPVTGMLLDYGNIKAGPVKLVMEYMDHGVILHEDDPVLYALTGNHPQDGHFSTGPVKLPRPCKAGGGSYPVKAYVTQSEPTAEVIAEEIAGLVQAWLDDLTTVTRIKLIRVEVRETPDTSATWRPREFV